MEILKGLPKTIRIGQFTLRFKVVNPTEHADIHGNNGLCDFDASIIYLDEELIQRANAERILNVVQHEIHHAIHYVYGLTDESTEEQFTELLTNGLVAFWLDNPRYETWRRRMLREIKKGRKE